MARLTFEADKIVSNEELTTDETVVEQIEQAEQSVKTEQTEQINQTEENKGDNKVVENVIPYPSITNGTKPEGIGKLGKCIAKAYTLNDAIYVNGLCEPTDPETSVRKVQVYGFDDAIALLTQQALNVFYRKDVKSKVINVETDEELSIKTVTIEFEGKDGQIHSCEVTFDLNEFKGQKRVSLAKVAKEVFEKAFVEEVTNSSGVTKRVKLKPKYTTVINENLTSVNRAFKDLNEMVKTGDYDRILYSDGKSLSSKRETFNVYRIDRGFVKLGAKGVVGKISMKIWKIVDDEEKVKISDDGEVSLKAEVLLLTSTSTDFDKFTPEAKEIVSLNFAGISHFVDTVKESEKPRLVS